MDKSTLLYVLEKVKAASKDQYSVFHTFEGEEDEIACKQLEEDGLICLYKKDGTHSMWIVK